MTQQKKQRKHKYSRKEVAAYKGKQRELFWQLIRRPQGLHVRF